MIIVKIQGGLGNQMFQYAFGRALSKAKDVKVIFDTSIYNGLLSSKSRREFKLDIFPTDEIISATPLEVFRMTGKIVNPYIDSILKKVNIGFQRKDKIYSENDINFKGLKSIPNDSYLDGFWQNEKYFESISSLLRKEYRFPEIKSSVWLNSILSENSVAVHVRRGDYLKEKKRGICSKEYYEKAIEYLSSKLKNPTFFFFSDDISWVEKEFDAHKIVKNGNKPDFEDMHLMSLCKHNIISNSTFSWWAAWLNSNINKEIIAPTPWFDHKHLDIVPDRWKKIERN